MSDGSEKNERVLHARIPESLERELRDKAAALGVSVSNLVRNILNNAIDLVEDVILDTSELARQARSDRAAAAPAPPGEDDAAAPGPAPVVGYQVAVLSLNALCARCNAILPKGSEAAVSVPGGREILCLACMKEATRDQ